MSLQVTNDIVTDVVKRSTGKAVTAKQNDTGSRFLNVRIQNGGKDIDIQNTAGVKVLLNVQRPDGSAGIIESGTVEEDGTVRVELTSWALEQAGTVSCDISIVNPNEDAKLTTMTFYVQVEAAVCDDEYIEDLEEYSLIVELLNETREAHKIATEAQTLAEEAIEKANEAIDGANEAANECVQIIEKCDQAAENANNAAAGVVTIEQNSQTPLQFWVGTQAEYDAIAEKDKTMFYIITDDDSEEQINARFDKIEQTQSEINSKVTDINNRLTVEDLTSQITDIEMGGSARLIKSGNLVNFSFTSRDDHEIPKWSDHYRCKVCQLPDNVVPAQRIKITPCMYVLDYDSNSPNIYPPFHAHLTIAENGVVMVEVFLHNEVEPDTVSILGLNFNTTYLLEG